MLKNIPQDKKKHIKAGAQIAILFTWIGYFFWPHQWIFVAGLSLGITFLAGFGFELFSYVTGIGHAELMDAIVTGLGGVVGMVIALFIYWLICLF